MSRPRRGATTLDFQRVSLALAAVLIVPALPTVLRTVLVVFSALSALASALVVLAPAGLVFWVSRRPEKAKALGRRVRSFDLRSWVKELFSEPSTADRRSETA